MAAAFDLIVIGAGVSGLASGKTFHQLNPEKSLLILEAAPSLGGTWAKDRLYPGLKSNNMLGTYEYPDFPMDPKTYGVQPGEHIPGAVLHDYLTRYAERFDILQNIRYDCKVLKAEHHESPDGGWTLATQNSSGVEYSFVAKKLVVATGLTSQPFMPDYRGQGEFGVPLFHNKDFVKHAGTIDTAKTVTVFGGTKSSWDAVYEYAIKGVHVDWVIRATGHGSAWMAPPYVTPLKKWLEKLVHTRLLTWLSPCIWGSADGYPRIRNFLHGTSVGRSIVETFWGILGNDVITLNKYDSHPELKKLKPWSEPIFIAAGLSILNYPTNFFDLVRDGIVTVHIADIDHLSSRTVHLCNGTSFQTDAFMSTTGWKHAQPIQFFPEGIERELGIPVSSPGASDAECVWNEDAVKAADTEILSHFPRLKNQPVQNKNLTPLVNTPGITSPGDAVPPSSPELTPYHLYRFMVPASERLLRCRDIALAGMLMNVGVAPVSHMQALWINAYFHDKLGPRVLPPQSSLFSEPQKPSGKGLADVKYETVLHARFGKWRYPAGYGARFPDFVFDTVPYLDLLLGDMGLLVHRKSGWFVEMTEPTGRMTIGTLWQNGRISMVNTSNDPFNIHLWESYRAGIVVRYQLYKLSA